MVVVRFNNIRDYLTISNMDITINVVNHIIISIFIDHVLVRIWSWILILPREKKTFWYSLIIMTFVSKVMAEGFEHHKPSHFVLSENWIPQKFDGWSSCFHIVPIKTPFKIAIWYHSMGNMMVPNGISRVHPMLQTHPYPWPATEIPSTEPAKKPDLVDLLPQRHQLICHLRDQLESTRVKVWSI